MNPRTSFLVVLIALLSLVASACGDDGDSPSDSPSNDTPSEAPSDDGADNDFGIDEDDLILPETSDDDDLATQLLGKVFGLPGDFITADERECLSSGLAVAFPDGVIPDDVQFDEELADALDAAAEPCGLNNIGR